MLILAKRDHDSLFNIPVSALSSERCTGKFRATKYLEAYSITHFA
ncbi:hypothetical protein D028_2051 [Vibrio parahaemolyticus 50]|nr:hypothetical protein D028_2051 [Vibrio parahaemolyticus 50]EVT82849.1 hypothetical protein D018_4034 [Vibrio parahaemolyticus VP2007-007]